MDRWIGGIGECTGIVFWGDRNGVVEDDDMMG